MWRCLWASLPLYLSHDRLWRDWRLWFSRWASFIVCWRPLVYTVPPRDRGYLGLRLIWGLLLRLRLRLWVRLWLGLFRHPSGIRHGPAFYSGCAILIGYWLHGVGLHGHTGITVGGGHVRESLRLLVAALGPSLHRGRLLKGEVRPVGLCFGAAGSSLQGSRGLNHWDIVWCVAALRRLALLVALQADTKYTLTENSYIHDKRLLLHRHSKNIYKWSTHIKRTKYRS